MTSLLQDVYDKTHRGRLMSEDVVLGHLHLRSGAAEGPDVDVDDPRRPKMHYDERYTKYIRQTGLLPFVQLVLRGVPKFNPCAITALVDRWRPETHTFHLPCGEMTVTLQDVSMITALPIKGDPVCRNTDTTGWRGNMTCILGREPEIPHRAAGAPFGWIARTFGRCPAELGEDSEEVQQHARAYLWYVLCKTIFSDGGGSIAPIMWLQLLVVWDQKWSWGTAALAYLYRQVTQPTRLYFLLTV